MRRAKQKKSLKTQLKRMVVGPVLCVGLVVLFISVSALYKSMTDETRDGLLNLSHQLKEYCNIMGEGEYSLEDGVLLKGGVPFGKDNKIVDQVHEISGIDATIFFEGKRRLTTIRNEDGSRAVGTEAAKKVQKKVLIEGEDYFSSHVLVNGESYYGYYTPLQNPDGEIVGMVFVGKARSTLMKTLFSLSITICLVVLLVSAIMLKKSLHYAGSVTAALNQTKEFLERAARGEIGETLNDELLAREDELGEMGRFALILQEEVTEMVGTDSLTGLYNRRSFNEVLANALEECRKHDRIFTVAIGDIDGFKKINDTFGHMAGDQVLRELAWLFKSHMEKKGFVARWGGEEFLFLYENVDKDGAIRYLDELMQSIRAQRIHYHGQVIPVRMTLGVTECRKVDNLDDIVSRADRRLYCGKSEGKDRIICKGA
ncbi:diguanylate cyclase [Faecalicatena sp. AGMB00832]|uniref:Diguanylate cyclase n=1 Tax=Faecalicatena faecalis TaxID=2726362 RepID=A0ABS6D9L9_9FIRM|nr:diguanylate cyclase [Faecalicatena faecalis]MBU3878314.1 diguanylate cyclase [Faecalicatena faecalis]